MSMDFGALIASEQKVEIIKQRLTQFITEGYQLSLNRQSAEKLGKEDQLEIIDNNLTLLETAILVHQAELSALSTAEAVAE